MDKIPTRDDCYVSCRDWSTGMDFRIDVASWKEALIRFKEEITRGAWDKIVIYGYWAIHSGNERDKNITLISWFTGAEKVWNKPKVNTYARKLI